MEVGGTKFCVSFVVWVCAKNVESLKGEVGKTIVRKFSNRVRMTVSTTPINELISRVSRFETCQEIYQNRPNLNQWMWTCLIITEQYFFIKSSILRTDTFCEEETQRQRLRTFLISSLEIDWIGFRVRAQQIWNLFVIGCGTSNTSSTKARKDNESVVQSVPSE